MALYFGMCVCTFVRMSICFSVCVCSLSVSVSVSVSVCLCVVCVCVSVPACLLAFLTACPSVRQSVGMYDLCLPLSLSLYIYPSFSLFPSFFRHSVRHMIHMAVCSHLGRSWLLSTQWNSRIGLEVARLPEPIRQWSTPLLLSSWLSSSVVLAPKNRKARVLHTPLNPRPLAPKQALSP